jgi:hypothetical protein
MNEEDEEFERIERESGWRKRQIQESMMQDELIDIAVQAGMAKEIAEVNIDIVEAFAKLVAEKEREACAKVADGWPDYDVQGLAEAIRARGEQA